jgi:hypothetical protein
MTIQEKRRIFFGLPALREAMQAVMPEIAPSIVPRGAVVRSVVVLTDPLMARIHVMPPGASDAAEAEVTAAQLGALLIRRCKSLGIPVPRAGIKGLQGDPTGIALVITRAHEAKGHSQLSVHRLSA